MSYQSKLTMWMNLQCIVSSERSQSEKAIYYTIEFTLTLGKVGLPWWLRVKEPTSNARATGDVGLIPGSGKYPEGGHGNSFQYSGLENPWTVEPGGLQSMDLQRAGQNERQYTLGNVQFCRW